MPVGSTSQRPVQVSGFDDNGRLTPLCRLVSASCSSGQRFACGFLQISPHGEHPCRPANSSPCRASRGLTPPSGCALPGAPQKRLDAAASSPGTSSSGRRARTSSGEPPFQGRPCPHLNTPLPHDCPCSVMAIKPQSGVIFDNGFIQWVRGRSLSLLTFHAMRSMRLFLKVVFQGGLQGRGYYEELYSGL